MAEPTYAEQIAAYRAHRHEREALERRVEIEREHAELIAQRDAVEDGDVDTFDFIDRQLEDLETEHSRLVPPAPPAPAFTDVEADVARQYAPAQFQESNWIMRSKYDTGPRATNAQVVQSGAQYAQAQYIQERTQRGLQTNAEDLATFRNSPAYRDALEVFAPPEKAGVSNADEFLKDLNATSKYKLDAKTYNRHARELQQRKARGDYPDR